jgi:glycosyltransferase involved in cell wall biosynthesis
MRVLVVRGDLNSASGYSQAIELYVERLAPEFDAVLGVDLHFHESRAMSRWDYPLVTDGQVQSLCRKSDHSVDVLTVSTPDNYRPFDAARNIGLFFWETDRLGRPAWISSINKGVDEMWVPAEFMVGMLEREGVTLPVRYLPCPLPQHVDVGAESDLGDMLLRSIDTDDMLTFDEVRARHPMLYLNTGTAIPRKGMPILAHEWCSLRAQHSDIGLIVKVGTIRVEQSIESLVREVRSLWGRVAQRLGLQDTHAYVMVARLDSAEMAALSRRTDAFLTTTLGEGFGLGTFESLAAERPAICPRHTAFSELLAPDYPYFLDTSWEAVGLADPTRNYPISARWGVVSPGALLATHARLADDRDRNVLSSQVENAAMRARDHVEAVWKEAALA